MILFLQECKWLRTVSSSFVYMSVVGFVTFISCPFVRVKSCFSHLQYIPFSDMGNNKPTDKLAMQKVFEMHAAGDSAAKITRS